MNGQRAVEYNIQVLSKFRNRNGNIVDLERMGDLVVGLWNVVKSHETFQECGILSLGLSLFTILLFSEIYSIF